MSVYPLTLGDLHVCVGIPFTRGRHICRLTSKRDNFNDVQTSRTMTQHYHCKWSLFLLGLYMYGIYSLCGYVRSCIFGVP